MIEIPILLFILLFALLLKCFSCIYLLWRNEKVYQFRTKLIDEAYPYYRTLPSYDEMLFKYWYVLDFEKFKDIR